MTLPWTDAYGETHCIHLDQNQPCQSPHLDMCGRLMVCYNHESSLYYGEIPEQTHSTSAQTYVSVPQFTA